MSIPLLSITIPNSDLLYLSKWNIVCIDECSSTNQYVKELKQKEEMHDRTAILADFQSKGRGQGSNIWHSTKANNLLVSLYRKIEIPADRNFMLTVIASLSIYSLLKSYDIECYIKWPNDIYYKNKKIAGILIENTLMQNKIIETVVGIGLNINENNFPGWVPNPCAIKQINGRSYNPADVCNDLLEKFDQTFEIFFKDKEELYHAYNSLLYRLNKWHPYKKNAKIFTGRIHGVLPDGRLILETGGGNLMHVVFGEIEYVI